MTPSFDLGEGRLGRTGRDLRPTWPRVAVLIGIFLLAFFVAKGCQDRQIRLTQEQAIAKAKAEIEFTPTLTQVRLLRQGLDRHPYWYVSLSIPIHPDDRDTFKRLALVKIDANTGKVLDVKEASQRDLKRGKEPSP